MTGSPPRSRPAPVRPRPRPAWKTLSPVWVPRANDALSPALVERLRPRDRHTDRNSDAEYQLYTLPSRFQSYLDEYLFAHERILAAVPWLASRPESRWGRIGRWLAPGGRQPVAGVVVVTDQQLFLLRDDVGVVGGSLAWGYVIQATTHERIAAVQVRPAAGDRARLHLALAADAARETITWDAPATATADVHRIAALLTGFLPRPADRRLRRIGAIQPYEQLVGRRAELAPGQTRSRADDALVAPAQVTVLRRTLTEAVARCPAPDGAPRHVHVTSIVPGDHKQGPMLVALTRAQLWRVPLPELAAPIADALTAVTSIEHRRSVLGHHVAWRLGTAAAVQVPFPAVAGERARSLFAALRQALTLLPVEANGPDRVASETS